jgi:hypothetical protein
MKRITKDMVERGGWRYCCVCRQLGPRVKAHWQYEAREYCDAHKPAAKEIVRDSLPVNQCDGCRVGAPLTDRRNHAMPDGGFMGCTKDRYAGPMKAV